MIREDACRVLETDPSASLEKAEMAWRDLVSVWPPDRHNNNERLRRRAEEKTKQINEAYRKPSKPLRRQTQGQAQAVNQTGRT